jgi:O-antigen/teichoic acid export membrane protein
LTENNTQLNDLLKQDKKGLSLKQNFSWTFLGNALYSLFQWGVLIVIAKIAGSEMLGEFVLGMTVTAPVLMLLNLQLRGVIATDAKCEYTFNDYFSLRIYCIAISFIIILLISSCYYWILNRGIVTALMILAIGVSKCFESVSDLLYGYLQQQERMDTISKSMILKGVCTIVVFVCGLYLSNGNILVATVLYTFSWLLTLIFYDFAQTKKVYDALGAPSKSFFDALSLKVLKKKHFELFMLSFPLGFVMFLVSLNVNIPRFFLDKYHGNYELGIFSGISYFIFVGTTIINALGQSATPRLSKLYADRNEKQFVILSYKIMGIGFIVGIFGIIAALLFGKEILIITYNDEFSQYNDLFVLMMIAGGIGYIASFIGFSVTATRKFSKQTLPFVVITGATAAASYLLIPSMGKYGAAYAAIISSVVNVILVFCVFYNTKKV